MSNAQQHHDSETLLKVPEVAQRCSVHVRTVRAWISAGHLPVLRFGRRCVRIDPRDLKRFLKQAGDAR